MPTMKQLLCCCSNSSKRTSPHRTNTSNDDDGSTRMLKMIMGVSMLSSLAIMAVVSTLLAFQIFDVSEQFLCIAYEHGYEKFHTCFPLVLNDVTFWSNENDFTGWARAIQAAAVLGIISCLLGALAVVWMVGVVIATSVTTIGLHKKDSPLLLSRVPLFLHIMAGCLAMLTLVAGVADVCAIHTPDTNQPSPTYSTPSSAYNTYYGGCSQQGIHIEEGASCMIVGGLLHFLAAGLWGTLMGCRRPSGSSAIASEQGLPSVSEDV